MDGPTRRPRIGLVLGGGGHAGLAFHAGALLSIQHHTGVDLDRHIDVIVGTSAGSIVASLLRLGWTPEDIAAFVADVEVTPRWRPHEERFRRSFEQRPVARLGNVFDVPGPRQWASAVRNACRVPLRNIAAGMLAGLVDPSASFEVFDEFGGAWPDRELRVVAVRRDGRRVTFGAEGSPRPALGRAVAASCAIPGYFAPVVIGGGQYIDGGTHSPTNADLLLDEGLDLVVVVSPMSAAPRAAARRLDRFARAFAGRRLHAEVQALEEAGTRVIVIEPRPDDLSAMGYNLMDPARGGDILREAFLSTGDTIAAGGLDPLPAARRPA